MENMHYYELFRVVPEEAKKTIDAGRLKGFTDINPMWRIKKLTETFGMVGVGWYYDVIKQWVDDGSDGQKVASTNIDLYVKVDGEWSKPIFGTGGSMLVANESRGAFTSNECVDGDCEVLTNGGWVKFSDYDGISEIAQFNKDTDIISFVKPINFIKKYSMDTYIKGDVIMTGGHRCLIERRTGSAKEKRFVDIAENISQYSTREGTGKSFCRTGKNKSFRDIHFGYLGESVELTPLQKVGIMLACDGTIYRKNSNGDTVWRLEFSKGRKIEKAFEYLRSAGIEVFSSGENDRSDGAQTTHITFKLSDGVNYKNYNEFLPLANYRLLMDEIVFWDGHLIEGKYLMFNTVRKDSAGYLQTLLALSGNHVTLKVTKRVKKNHSDIYTLYQKQNGSSMIGIEKLGIGTDVYCVEVPDTFFLIRKNGIILVTGNCWKMSLTDSISSACKVLGIGADVYFEKDRTKYDASGNEESKPTGKTIIAAIANMSKCKSMEEVTACWNSNAEFQTDEKFIESCRKVQVEIKKNNK